MVSLVLISATITNHAIEQNVERGQVIAELAETNRRLESALAENAELHEQLVAQAREAGVQDERQRLAGEIHDTLAQGLTGIITQLGAAEQTRHRPAESDRHLTLARELARDSLTEARRSVHALRPEQLETAGLPAALADLARTWSRQTAVAAELETCGEPEQAPAEVEAALFRVAQEALANVGKHAGASRTRLTLTYLDGTVLLDVHDDGAGFVTGRRTDGYGLVGMRTRLDKVGGALTVESGPGARDDRQRIRAAASDLVNPSGCSSSTTIRSCATACEGVFTDDPEFEVVGEASDGAEAVRLAQRVEVDVILMDLRMPGIGGVAAIRELRALRSPGPRADPHDLRHRPGRTAGARGRRDRVPAEGRPARGTAARRPRGACRTGCPRAVGRDAARHTRRLAGAATGSARANSRCCAWSRQAGRTRRSRGSSSSARRPSRRTCCTSTASSRCEIEPRPLRSPTSAA